MSVCVYCVCFSEIESPVKYQNQWPQPSPNPLLWLFTQWQEEQEGPARPSLLPVQDQ